MNREELAFELEAYLLCPTAWTDDIIDRFPEDLQEELRDSSIAGGPIGIGEHPEHGWFCLGCGQGPFIIWMEDD